MKVSFPNTSGESLSGRLELPATAPRATALFAHCFTCSKDVAAASRISRGLCRRGFAVLRFDFTGLGNSDGDFANTNFSSNVDDLVAAADFLRTEHGAPRILIGHSLGGAAVLAAAERIPEVAGVVTINSPSDPAHVRELLTDDEEAIREQGEATVLLAGREFRIQRQFLEDLDEQRLAPRIRGMNAALLVLHAPDDELVEVDQARRIYAAANHPKSFVSLDGADHLLSRPADSEYVSELVAAWSARYLPEREDELEASEGLVRVRWAGRGLAHEVRAGRHGLVADEPSSLGGEDAGPTPYGLLLSALGTCTGMTLVMYARHKGWDLRGVEVTLEHDRIHARDCEDCETREGKIDLFERVLVLEGDLDDAQRERLLEIADRCPVHRTLEGTPRITTRLAGEAGG